MHGATGARRTSAEDLDDLIETHQAAVWRYLRFLGAEGSQAEDLLQETFFSIWKKPFEQRSASASRQFLFTVARNLFLMARRRGRVRLHFETVDEAELAWAMYAEDGGQAYLDGLRNCLAELPDRSRQAIELHYFDRVPRADVGRVLGVSVEGVKTLLRRVRSELRECVERRIAQ